jgi:hypothetical protein
MPSEKHSEVRYYTHFTGEKIKVQEVKRVVQILQMVEGDLKTV